MDTHLLVRGGPSLQRGPNGQVGAALGTTMLEEDGRWCFKALMQSLEPMSLGWDYHFHGYHFHGYSTKYLGRNQRFAKVPRPKLMYIVGNWTLVALPNYEPLCGVRKSYLQALEISEAALVRYGRGSRGAIGILGIRERPRIAVEVVTKRALGHMAARGKPPPHSGRRPWKHQPFTKYRFLHHR